MNEQMKYRLLPKKYKEMWSYEDFLYYRMQEKSFQQIKSIMTPPELEAIEKKCNQDDFRIIFNSKRTFLKTFQRFIHRNVLFCSENSYALFCTFLKNHKKVIIKPDDQYAGIGIYELNLLPDLKTVSIKSSCNSNPMIKKDSKKLSDCETIAAVYDFCASNSYIMEEYVFQDKNYASIAPNSLNTIRITTYLKGNGEPSILFAVNQFGYHESIVDNNDDYSIWGFIDLTSGIIKNVNIDEKTKHLYIYHPDTHRPVIGFQNPNFEEVKELAIKASLIVPECRLIGWDIARKIDGKLELIEGNVTPELDLYQAISDIGLRGVWK